MNQFPAFDWKILEPLVERLGWVLLYSLWQFALVALLAGAIARALRRNSASVRYNVLAVAMAGLVAIPAVTWMLQARDERFDPASGVASGVAGTDSQRIGSRWLGEESLDTPRAVVTGLAQESFLTDDTHVSAANSQAQRAVSPSGANIQPELSWSENAKTALRPWLAWIVAGWCLGVVFCSARPLLGWHTLRRLRRVCLSPVPDDVLSAMNRVAVRLRLGHTVRVLQSTLTQVPVLVGYLQPVILLPVSLVTTIPSVQLEAILAHELAHVRRHDFVVNLLQTLVETLFFYHPAVWWLSRQVRVEREHCCDDLVVKLFDNRIEYGRALVAIEELRGQSSVLALGAGDGSLLSRVRRIVGHNSDRADIRPSDHWPVALASLACLGLAFVLSMSLDLAAKDDEEKKNEPAIAKLPGDITVELIGVGFHPSKEREWWKPDGSQLEPRPILDGRFEVMPGSPEQVHCREFLIHIRGLPREHSVITDYGGVSSATGSSYADGLWVGEHGAGPFKSKTTTIRLGLTIEPYGPTVTIDVTGRKQAIAKIPANLRPFYDRIAPIRVEESAGQVELLLEESASNELQKLAAWELLAIDIDGQQHRISTVTGAHAGKVGIPLTHIGFRLPRDRVAHFEHRLRPYRHWVTFANVSLQPGMATAVKVSVESLPQDTDVDSQALLPDVAPDKIAPDLPGIDPELVRPIHGVVLDAQGRQAAGIKVVLQSQASGIMSTTRAPDAAENLAETVSNAEGRFSFEGVLMRPGYPGELLDGKTIPLDIIAVAPGQAIGWAHTSPTGDVRINLKPATQLGGTVRNAGGLPIAGANVCVNYLMSIRHIAQADLEQGRWPRSDDSQFINLAQSKSVRVAAITDENGRFHLDGLPAGSGVFLELRHPDYQIGNAFAATVDRLDPENAAAAKRLVQVGELQISMARGHHLAVQVVFDDTGAPAAFAKFPSPPIIHPPDGTADDQGRFEFRHVRDGKFDIYVYAPEGSERLSVLHTLELQAGTYKHDVEIRLPRGVLLTGRVIDDKTQQGIPAAKLIWWSPQTDKRQSGTRTISWGQFSTDKTGAFREPVSTGAVNVTIAQTVEGYRPIQPYHHSFERSDPRLWRQLMPAENESPVRVEFALTRQPSRRGIVHGPDGKPAGNIEFAGRVLLGTGMHRDFRETTVADGTFELPDLFQITADDDRRSVFVGFRDARRSLGGVVEIHSSDPAETPVEVQLWATSAVRGRLVDRATGEPIRRTGVRFHGYPGSSRLSLPILTAGPASTNQDGEFSLGGLVPGVRYWVSPDKRGYVGIDSSLSFLATTENTDMGDVLLTPRPKRERDAAAAGARSGRPGVKPEAKPTDAKADDAAVPVAAENPAAKENADAPLTLEDAVAAANEQAAKERLDVASDRMPAIPPEKWPAPVTVDEVVKAIQGWDRKKVPVTDETYRIYQRIAETKVLPPRATLDFRTQWLDSDRNDKFEYRIWKVQLDVFKSETTGFGFAVRNLILDRRIALRPSPGHWWIIAPRRPLPAERALAHDGMIVIMEEDRDGALVVIVTRPLKVGGENLRIVAFDDEGQRFDLAGRRLASGKRGSPDEHVTERFRLDPRKLARHKVQYVGIEAADPDDLQQANAPLKGLEFLASYLKLHGLSLDMTEPQFLAIAERQKLSPRKTSEGGSIRYLVPTGDGHTVIVMFGENGKCSGIQRVRGEEPAEK